MKRRKKMVTLFSGGSGSWAAGKRVAEVLGPENQILLFTDTKTEDEDLYRFITEAADNIGSELITLADGRDVWEVFFDEKFIGNTRIDICSRILKRDLARNWINENCPPEEWQVALGIDWTEVHRYERAAPHWKPYELVAPMCDEPYLDKSEVHAWLEAEGIALPRLYQMGFPHNNCGGFCVKQGHAGFKQLLEQMPERYAYHEAKEDEFRQKIGKDVAIMRDRRGGVTTPLTMHKFRLRVQGEEEGEVDENEWGGCGCMVDFGEEG